MKAPTPGPWMHGDLSDEILTLEGESVAAPPDGYDEEQWHADAPLIAAAPDLLRALKDWQNFDLSLAERQNRAIAAIKKAEGR